jgi:hypothetical protein
MGVVEGGWAFVAAAYMLTATVLGAYATSVFLRDRVEKDRVATEGRRETRV